MREPLAKSNSNQRLLFFQPDCVVAFQQFNLNMYLTCLPTPIRADTRILVQSTCGDSSTILTCNDDSLGCTNFGSVTASVSMSAGTIYYVAVGGFGVNDYGAGSLTVQLAPTAAPTQRPTQASTEPELASNCSALSPPSHPHITALYCTGSDPRAFRGPHRSPYECWRHETAYAQSYGRSDSQPSRTRAVRGKRLRCLDRGVADRVQRASAVVD